MQIVHIKVVKHESIFYLQREALWFRSELSVL